MRKWDEKCQYTQSENIQIIAPYYFISELSKLALMYRCFLRQYIIIIKCFLEGMRPAVRVLLDQQEADGAGGDLLHRRRVLHQVLGVLALSYR